MSALSPYWDGFNRHGGDSIAQIDKDGFNVRIPVQDFKPEEITVKTVNDTIYVNAKHFEKQGQGSSHVTECKREVSQQFNLPRGFNPDHVVSSLSNGYLSIKCPLPPNHSAPIQSAPSTYQAPVPRSGFPSQWSGFNNQVSNLNTHPVGSTTSRHVTIQETSNGPALWNNFNNPLGDCKAHVDSNGLHVSIDVPRFKPEDISVKTVNNTVIIHARFEEKHGENSYIERVVTRQFDLPKGFRPEQVASSLLNGVLSIKCPLPPNQSAPHTYQVPIQHTGLPAH